GCAAHLYGTVDMSWVSATDGWIQTDCPATTFVHTTDGGRHWTAEPLPSCVCNVFSMSFVDGQHGFLTGQSEVMLTTSDGGTTWKQRSIPRGVESVEFTDP